MLQNTVFNRACLSNIGRVALYALHHTSNSDLALAHHVICTCAVKMHISIREHLKSQNAWNSPSGTHLDPTGNSLGMLVDPVWEHWAVGVDTSGMACSHWEHVVHAENSLGNAR